jgi:hypothetical protein
MENNPSSITRRTFLRTLALATLGSTAAEAGLSGCKARLKSTPQSYYTDRQAEIVKENRKVFTAMRPLLAEKFSAPEVNAIDEATFQRFDTLLPDLPYIGGSGNDLTANLENSAVALAFYQEMKARAVPVEETGRILFQAVTALYTADPMSKMMGRLANSTLAQDKVKKEAEASQQRIYPQDWVFDFVPGDGSFDFGIDYTECGICKYFQAQGAPELTPFMCLLDAPISRAMNTGLVRTQTLARGDGRCDFRYKTGGTIQMEWDPGYVNGGK